MVTQQPSQLRGQSLEVVACVDLDSCHWAVVFLQKSPSRNFSIGGRDSVSLSKLM
jgi:hypothetical protein